MTTNDIKSFIRAFFAIDLPHDTKKTIANIISDCQKLIPRNAVRFVKPENLHITLQFLEKIDANDVGKLTQAVKNEITTLKPFFIEWGKCELFPTPYDPHIISLQIGPHDLLKNLSGSIGRGIVKSGYDVETRPYRGHLTLGRIQRNHKPISIDSIKLPTLEKTPVNEIIFFQSKPDASGSNYIPLERLRLEGTLL